MVIWAVSPWYFPTALSRPSKARRMSASASDSRPCLIFTIPANAVRKSIVDSMLPFGGGLGHDADLTSASRNSTALRS